MIEKTSSGFKQPLRVLVVEDNQIDRRILESMLSESSSAVSFLKSTDTLAGARKLLSDHTFDVVILDLNLPDSEGEETLLNLNREYPSVAIVINTGAYEDELGLHTLGSGAQEFLVKGKYTAYVLNKAVHYALERKRLEIELTQAYERLKETQSQILQMEKMKVIGALASGIAHEVKNPLSAIAYGAAYLSEQVKSADDKVKSALQDILEAADRANTIINDLLNFAGTTRLEKRSEDLNAVVEKALTLLRHEFEKKRVEVIRRLDEAAPGVKIDRNRIEQVLINLLLNAVQSAPDGGKVELKTHYHTVTEDFTQVPRLDKNKFQPGRTIVICDVEDNGGGIPEDQISRIFDPFFTTRQDKGGVGLGLSVSKNIMESHDGDILIENKPGGGVRARLIFPSDGVSL